LPGKGQAIKKKSKKSSTHNKPGKPYENKSQSGFIGAADKTAREGVTVQFDGGGDTQVVGGKP